MMRCFLFMLMFSGYIASVYAQEKHLDLTWKVLITEDAAFKLAWKPGENLPEDDLINSQIQIFYIAHSQSTTNEKQNKVIISLKNLRTNKMITKTDSYDSQTQWGTPAPGYEHCLVFNHLDFRKGDCVEMTLAVEKGDWENYVSGIQIFSCWHSIPRHNPPVSTFSLFMEIVKTKNIKNIRQFLPRIFFRQSQNKY